MTPRLQRQTGLFRPSLGTIEVRNGDTSALATLDRNVTDLSKSSALKPIFNLKTVQDNQAAGRIAGQLTMSIVGDIAKSHTQAYDDARLKAAGAQSVLDNPASTYDEKAQAQLALNDANQTMQANQAEYDAWKDGSANKIILHTIAGGLTAAVGGGSALGGAVGAGVREANSTNTENLSKTARAFASLGIGAIGGGSGASAALTGELFNRELHQSEIDRIKQMANGDPKVEAELLAAACAMVKCSAGIPKNDPSYAFWAALEAVGNEPQFKDVREWLSLQAVATPVYTAGVWTTSIEMLYGYGSLDKLADWSSRNSVGTRSLGGLQMVGGAAQIVGGGLLATTCGTLLGCVAAGYVGTAGLDNMIAGTNTLLTGTPTSTWGGYALQKAGFSPGTAELVYGLTQLVPGAVDAVSVYRAVNAQTSFNNLARASYEPVTTNGINVTNEVMATPVDRSLVAEIQAGNPAISYEKATEKAIEYLESGTTLPRPGIALPGSVMVKVVPKGDGVTDTSGYWLSVEQARVVATMSPQQASEVLGLPAAQAARMQMNGMDFYSITPNAGVNPKIFTSNIAGTSQGTVSMGGGLQQVIVPNRTQWTMPQKTDPFKVR